MYYPRKINLIWNEKERQEQRAPTASHPAFLCTDALLFATGALRRYIVPPRRYLHPFYTPQRCSSSSSSCVSISSLTLAVDRIIPSSPSSSFLVSPVLLLSSCTYAQLGPPALEFRRRRLCGPFFVSFVNPSSPALGSGGRRDAGKPAGFCRLFREERRKCCSPCFALRIQREPFSNFLTIF